MATEVSEPLYRVHAWLPNGQGRTLDRALGWQVRWALTGKIDPQKNYSIHRINPITGLSDRELSRSEVERLLEPRQSDEETFRSHGLDTR